MAAPGPLGSAENGSKAPPRYALQQHPSAIHGAATSDNSAVAVKTTAESEPSHHETISTEATTRRTDPAEPTAAAVPAPEKRWPGWPGDCVFRLIVPVLKVGSIIGRKGELIKKTCEETRARIRVLDGAVGTPDRVVLISAKEEPEAPVSPAMDAVLRVFKRVSGLSESELDGNTTGAAGVAFCSVRLLVASPQAVYLIGKQGSLIKSIQGSSSASVRVLSGDELPFVASDERIVEMQGEALKVKIALETVLGYLRKFLVDHTVVPLFEKNYNNIAASQDHQVANRTDKSLMYSGSQPGVGSDYSIASKRDSLFLDRETPMDLQIAASGIPSYVKEPSFSASRSSGLHTRGPIVTQVVQTMQIPLSYAEDIIGIEGTNIAYIRRSSGAILTVQECRGLPDEITVEIKGSSSQVQIAQQLIQDFISNHKDSVVGSGYGRMEAGPRSGYSQLGNMPYSSSSISSLSGRSYGGYGSSGVGGYSSFRL